VSRPAHEKKYCVNMQPLWTCVTCKNKHITCKTCMQQLPDAAFNEHRLAHWHATRYYEFAICNTCRSVRARLFGRSKTASQFRQERSLRVSGAARRRTSANITPRISSGTCSRIRRASWCAWNAPRLAAQP
jgi:hypothetical protein